MADLTYQSLLQPDSEELTGLNRNRALSQMLLQNAQKSPQGQMVDGHYVKSSPLQFANQLFNAYAGNKGLENADVQQQQLAAALRGKQQESVQNYIKAAQGTPAQMYPEQAGPMPTGGNIPQQIQTPATGPNYGEMFKAGTSQYAPKELQSATYEMLKPQKLGEGETIQNLNMGTGKYEPMAQGGEKLTPDEKGYNLATKQGFRGTFMDYKLALNKATASNVTVHTGNALGESFGKGIGEEDLALRKAAKGAQQTVDQADLAIKNLPKAITGAGADYRLQAAKVLNVLGANNQDTIKASEQAFSQRSQALLGRVKSSGLAGSQGLTEGERKFLTNAYGGSLNLDESSLRSMLMLEKRLAVKDAQQWNQRIKEMPQEVVRGAGVGPVSVPNLGDIDTNNPLLR